MSQISSIVQYSILPTPPLDNVETIWDHFFIHAMFGLVVSMVSAIFCNILPLNIVSGEQEAFWHGKFLYISTPDHTFASTDNEMKKTHEKQWI